MQIISVLKNEIKLCSGDVIMKNTDFALIYELVGQQEDALKFSTFSNSDAFSLGSFICNSLAEKKICLAVSIRKLNGSVIFQYLPDNTTANNENWLRRKFNTVSMYEMSSLRAWAKFSARGKTVSDFGLSPSDYVFYGGAFPIRLQSGELVAVICASNLAHEQDHQMLVDIIADYLHISDVPRIEFN